MSEADKTTLEDRIAAFDPSDPEALAALEKDVLGGEGAELETDEAKAETDEVKGEAVQQDDKQATAEGAPSGAQEPKVVQAKDGKHVIPYSVLERERERASRAEAELRSLSQQLEQLKAGKTPDADAAATAAQITDEDLAEIEDISPEIAKVIKGLRAEVERLTQDREDAQKTKEQEIQDEVDAAIEAHPDLRAWKEAAFRDENPDTAMWDRAAAIDSALRKDPDWIDKTFAERFAKVAEIVKSIHGVQTPAPTTKEPTDLKQAADAKLKAQGAPVPTSLSDIPGGSAPASSDIENLENISTVALGNKFMNMSPEQMESYLARLGI